MDGINALRTLFPTSYFDKERCRDGLFALRNYHYELVEDPVKRTFSRVPAHDWSSHAADAGRYVAVGMRTPNGTTGRVSSALLAAQEEEDGFIARLTRYGSGVASSVTSWMK